MIKILLVDDEVLWLNTFKKTLIQYSLVEPYCIFTATSGSDAFIIIEKEKIDIVFLDLMMPDENVSEILGKITNSYPGVFVVMLTGINNVQSAVACMKQGASDYFIKNWQIDELLSNVSRIIKICALRRENAALKDSLLSTQEVSPHFSAFITVSSKMIQIFKYLSAVARNSQPVLITGESGTGKGVLAKIIAKIARPDKPFIAVNAAGLDVQMFSDTLFGHVKGAFTGADNKRTGAIQQACDGIVFLDEIGDIPVQSQIKLLYITQEGEYQQLGSDKVEKTTAKFIFATNQDLKQKKAEGTFRHDLYYRLSTHHIHIPPLRERPEDILPLFSHFLNEAALEYKTPVPKISDKLYKDLPCMPFYGNAREVRALAYDFVAKLCSGCSDLSAMDTFSGYDTATADGLTLQPYGDVLDEMISKAMKLTNNNQTKAAAMLGISQATVSRKLKKKTTMHDK